jgi:hypothetical protein
LKLSIPAAFVRISLFALPPKTRARGSTIGQTKVNGHRARASSHAQHSFLYSAAVPVVDRFIASMT